MPVPPSCSKITRRQALGLGAAAGITAATGVPAEAVAAAAGDVIAGAGPSYLRRSTYRDRVGEDFALRGHVLRLVAVGDVAGAAVHPALRDDEGTFALELEGPADVIGSEIHELSHPLLGPFPMFLSAVGDARGTSQRYEATIDRSVRLKPGPTAASSAPASDGDRGDGDGKAEEPAAEPSARDLEVMHERLVAASAPAAKRRAATRRATRKLRHTHANRVRFKRKQSARMKRARTGWLKRHGR